MTAKCGMYVRWHWAHKPRFDCDPWQEAETDWHLTWKDAFPSDCQELVQIDENTGEKHVADVKTPSGVVVEVQHSRISDHELSSRENFYGDMIWIVDAREIVWMTSRDLVCVEPMAYGFKILSRNTLLKRWSSATRPVYFDNTSNLYHDKVSDTLWVLPPEKRIPISDRTLWRVLSFDSENNEGVIAPIPAQWMVEATMNDAPVPLARCDEKDAWQYGQGWSNLMVKTVGDKPLHQLPTFARENHRVAPYSTTMTCPSSSGPERTATRTSAGLRDRLFLLRSLLPVHLLVEVVSKVRYRTGDSEHLSGTMVTGGRQAACLLQTSLRCKQRLRKCRGRWTAQLVRGGKVATTSQGIHSFRAAYDGIKLLQVRGAAIGNGTQ